MEEIRNASKALKRGNPLDPLDKIKMYLDVFAAD
jgi:hypothetical protein